MFLCSPLTSHFVTHNNNLEQEVLDHNYTIKFHSEEKALKQRYFNISNGYLSGIILHTNKNTFQDVLSIRRTYPSSGMSWKFKKVLSVIRGELLLSILAHDRVTGLPFSMGSVVTILVGTECLQCVGEEAARVSVMAAEAQQWGLDRVDLSENGETVTIRSDISDTLPMQFQ